MEKDKNMTNDNTVNTSEAILQGARKIRVKEGNIIPLTQLPITPTMLGMCEEQELVEVKPIYEYDESNRPILDKVAGYSYVCLDGKSWYTFKVFQTKPIISQADLDQRETSGISTFVKIPIDKIAMKCYQLGNDRAIIRLSIQVPYLELL